MIETIGNATLYCCDCREIIASLPKIDALITDPPYGVFLGKTKDARRLAYTTYDDTPENYSNVVVPAIREALGRSERGLVFGVPPMIWGLPEPDVMGGIYLPAACGRNKWGFSNLSHALLYGRAPRRLGAKHTAFASTQAAEKNGHPCPKPISWMMWAVALASLEGELILDPFMGSGTTGVAAIKQGRQFIGIEADPAYFEIARERIDDATRQSDMFLEKSQKSSQIKLDF